MTLEEKISLCNGADFWHSKAMEQYGIPAITMSDGPHGVRCQKDASDMLGVNRSEPATCFPTAVTSGATWDAALLKAEGKAIGEEGLSYGVDVVLGPGVNIKRNPSAAAILNISPRTPVQPVPWAQHGCRVRRAAAQARA